MDSAYASTFLNSLGPKEAAAVVRDRLEANRTIHEELGDWFKDLREIEQSYGRALLKLTERQTKFASADLGITQNAWAGCLQTLTGNARAHINAGDRLNEDVIRHFSRWEPVTESANVSALERDLSALAKSLDQAETRIQKAETSKFGNKANKQAGAQEDLEKARAGWDADAPRVFENLQRLDERRVANFKDAIVRWQTADIDTLTGCVQRSEALIASVLEIVPTDEPMQVITQRLARGSMVPGVTPGQAPGSTRASGVGAADSAPRLDRRTSTGEDSGSIRSSGGVGNSLKSKFGTLLRGKRSTSPSKRKSISGASNGTSNNRNDRRAAAPAPIAEEPAAQSAPVIPAPVPTAPLEPPREAPRETYQTPAAAEPVYIAPPSEPQPQQNTASVNGAFNNGDVGGEAAFSNVSSSLRASNTVSRRTGGRRDSRSLLSAGDTQAVARDVLGTPLARNDSPADATFGSAAASPAARQLMTHNLGRHGSFSNDASSIRSGHSSSSSPISPAGPRHTEPSEAGLHLSVIESTQMLPSGELQTSGEAAFCDRSGIDGAALQLQLQPPSSVSRVIANRQVLDERSDNLYAVQADLSTRMTPLFKYQVATDEISAKRFQPITLEQKWTTEETQTSVKLVLRPHSAFASQILLQDLEIHVSLDGPAKTCVAKPAGTFVKRANKLVWKLGAQTLDPATPINLLARFKTDATTPPASHVEARWKTTASNLSRGSGFALLASRVRENPFDGETTNETAFVSYSYVLQASRWLFATTA
ncbi:Suppressor of Profilin deletion [Savitreella phatthalungensis]